MGRPGGAWASRRSGQQALRRTGARTTRPTGLGKMFSQRAKEAAPAKPALSPQEKERRRSRHQAARVREKIFARPGERSERPVAGTDEAAQADQAGREAAHTTR